MSKLRTIAVVTLAATLVGCSVVHGQVDFVSAPLFEIPLGGYSSIMFFRNCAVLRIHGGTWYTLSVPFYVLVPAILGVPALLWFALRRRRHERAS